MMFATYVSYTNVLPKKAQFHTDSSAAGYASYLVLLLAGGIAAVV